MNILKYRVNTSNSREYVEKLNEMIWDARVFILSAVSVTIVFALTEYDIKRCLR